MSTIEGGGNDEDDDSRDPQHTSLVTLADYEAVETVEQALHLERQVLAQQARNAATGDELRTATPAALDSGWRWSWTHVLALDVGYARHCEATVAAGVLYHVATSSVVASRTQHAVSRFAYRPGLLAFREVPLLARVAEALLASVEHDVRSDDVLLLCDGHGTLHPRGCGVACHLGMLLDRPSIGVGKSYFVGEAASAETEAASPPPPDELHHKAHTCACLRAQLDRQRGARLALHIDKGSDQPTAGYMLRTQTAARPMFISAGYRITQADACDAVLQLCHTYRQPEPIRHADHLGRVEVRNIEQQSAAITIAIPS